MNKPLELPLNGTTLPAIIREDSPNPREEGRAFDWLTDAADVVIPPQGAVAIYWHPSGDLIIRQERSAHDYDDQVIRIRPEYLQAVIDRLCDEAGIGSAP